jgi:hypothetical protein
MHVSLLHTTTRPPPEARPVVVVNMYAGGLPHINKA